MSLLADKVKSHFPGRNVVIIGDMVADQFLNGTISRVSREAPVFILRHDTTETRPGGAANTAANVASLGGTPILIGLIGDDAAGRLLVDSLETGGVRCDKIVVGNRHTTTTKVRVLAGQHYAARQQVIRIDYEDQISADQSIKDSLNGSLLVAGETADAIILSDYGYGVASGPIFNTALEIALRRRIPLVVDSRFSLRSFPGATTATPNQDEVEQILGSDFSEADCDRLREEIGYEALLVTCGNRGMQLFERNKPVVRIDAVGSSEPVDVTGAGDTVIAAYSLGLASNLNHLDAARIANHAGAIVVMKKGTATASASEVVASLNEFALGRPVESTA